MAMNLDNNPTMGGTSATSSTATNSNKRGNEDDGSASQKMPRMRSVSGGESSNLPEISPDGAQFVTLAVGIN